MSNTVDNRNAPHVFVHNFDVDDYDNALTLGSDLVTNGNFDSGTSNWSVTSGWALSFSPTYLYLSSSYSNQNFFQTQFITSGDMYLAQFDIITVSGTQWSVKFACAGYEHKIISSIYGEGAGTYKVLFRAVNGGGFTAGNGLTFYGWTGSSTSVAIDSVSLKHVDSIDNFRGQWVDGAPWPLKGAFKNSTLDQSKWWVG